MKSKHSPHRSHQTPAECVGFWCSNRRFHGLQSKRGDGCVQFCGEHRVSIMNEASILVIAGYGFAQLLNRPFGGWVLRDVAAKNASGTDFHHHKDIKDAKAGGDRDHEVAREQRPGVIAGKCAPILRLPRGPGALVGQ
jgi:hypothetical protein